MAQIFISYRQTDASSSIMASQIYTRLSKEFHKKNISKDIDKLGSKQDFREVLWKETADCKVMLVIIGVNWANTVDIQGKRCLDNPDDFVRLEVERGLHRGGVLVIPLLINNATLPKSTELPDSLKELSYHQNANAMEIRDVHFDRDMDRIISQFKHRIEVGWNWPHINWTTVIGIVFIPVIVGFIQLIPWIENKIEEMNMTQVAQAAQITATFVAGQTATATLWTDTPIPTITLTPSITPTKTITPDPVIIAYKTQLSETATAQYFIDLTPTETHIPSSVSISTRTSIPQNGLIVFIRDGDIYTIKADRNGVRYLLTQENNSSPVWSPDGKRIAFSSDKEGPWNIYVMEVDSNIVTRLTTEGNNFDPAWSPDGRQLVFRSDRDGNDNIYMMWVNGIPVTRLTREGENSDPVWSPDGKRIAFSSDREGRWNIYMMELDSDIIVRLTTEGNNFDPAWSPGGGQLIFRSDRDGNDNIYMMWVNGIPVTRLTTEGNNFDPAWSPDGQYIVFIRDGDVYTMKIEEREVTRLTYSGTNSDPAWQPLP